MCLCLCERLPHLGQCPQEPEGIGSRRTGVAAIVSCLAWVLGAELRSSGGTSALNHGAISPVPMF